MKTKEFKDNMEETTYQDMTEEQLGDFATREDLRIFIEMCREWQDMTDCTDEEATDYIWQHGDWKEA